MNAPHPLVDRIAQSLLPLWKDLPEVAALPLEANLREVRGELEGDEMAIGGHHRRRRPGHPRRQAGQLRGLEECRLPH